MCREAAKQELQLSQLEGQLSRLTRDAVDQQTLLHTMQEDKEALSRWERSRGGREGRGAEETLVLHHCFPMQSDVAEQVFEGAVG